MADNPPVSIQGPVTGLVHGAGVLADKLIAGFAALALARLVAPLRLRDEPIPRLLRPRSPRR